VLTQRPARPGQGLWVATLGPLEALRDGRPLSIGPPARRAVLGLLLMHPGRLVRRDAIIDVLWGQEPPRTAVGLVQAHVSRLRQVLELCGHPAEDAGVLHSVRDAYRLSLSCEELDLLVFRDLAARAVTARARGDDAAAYELYEQAVGLWRGDPLADVAVLSGNPGITLLRQQLVGVLLRYAETACALGQYRAVLPRLQALAAAEPLNESAHAYLMIALAGSGQQAAAIRVYEDLRSRLDQELGLYPGEELVEAHVRVLRQDIRAGERRREYARDAAPADVVEVASVIPRQLPAASRYFIGRIRELDILYDLLERNAREPNGVMISALTGMAGIGKTALAVYWAHQVAARFPDGQLFADLHGFSRFGAPVPPAEVVSGFLTALGVSPSRIPPHAVDRAALYRSLLAGRRMLIVLDNAQNAEQVRSLLPGSPGCLVLVTSRSRLTGLAAGEGANLHPLDVLTDSESRDLLATSLGAERVMAEPAAVTELISLCARLPLALCDVASRVAARPGLPLAWLAAEMRNARAAEGEEFGLYLEAFPVEK
jgi:DNA-binding SARP family transcriptional activator